MRILYAEDERDLNDIVSRRLASEGYSIDRCFDGAEAWDYLQAADYDAAILDIMMPKLDGLTVLRKLRAAGKNTPVLLLTARGFRSRGGAGLRRERLSGKAVCDGGIERATARNDPRIVRRKRQRT